MQRAIVDSIHFQVIAYVDGVYFIATSRERKVQNGRRIYLVPMRHNSPSSPVLLSADPTKCELERERSLLIAAIDSFASQGAACCTSYPHPFFGQLKPEQWAILMYKHVDHHLRQFGV